MTYSLPETWTDKYVNKTQMMWQTMQKVTTHNSQLSGPASNANH